MRANRTALLIAILFVSLSMPMCNPPSDLGECDSTLEYFLTPGGSQIIDYPCSGLFIEKGWFPHDTFELKDAPPGISVQTQTDIQGNITKRLVAASNLGLFSPRQVHFVYTIPGGLSGNLLPISGAGRFDVSTDPKTQISTSAAPMSITAGQSSQLDVTVTGGTPPYSFSWSPSDSLNNGAIATPLAKPTATTTYFVDVTDVVGQSVRNISLTVNVSSGPPSFTLTVAGVNNAGAVSSTPSGINFGCGATCSASFASGTTVLLVSEGGKVTWSGCDFVDGSPAAKVGTSCTVHMNANRAVTILP